MLERVGLPFPVEEECIEQCLQFLEHHLRESEDAPTQEHVNDCALELETVRGAHLSKIYVPPQVYQSFIEKEENVIHCLYLVNAILQ